MEWLLSIGYSYGSLNLNVTQHFTIYYLIMESWLKRFLIIAALTGVAVIGLILLMVYFEITR
jgi:polyferredoxin